MPDTMTHHPELYRRRRERLAEQITRDLELLLAALLWLGILAFAGYAYDAHRERERAAAVDALVACAFYGAEGDTCEREAREATR